MNRIDDPRHDQETGVRDSTLDTTRIDDVRIGAVRPLMTPALLQERVPVQQDTLALVESSRRRIADVLHGRDHRLVVVVGPCSIHDHDQAIDYYTRALQMTQNDENLHYNVARAYFEKGDIPKAEHHLEKCLELNKGHEEAKKFQDFIKNKIAK